MSVVVNMDPNFKYRPVWLTGEIDFPVEMTLGHLEQTTTGIRGGAAKQFEYEWSWACQRFREGMEKKGHVYIGLPPGIEGKLSSLGAQAVIRNGYVVDGPFLPMSFAASDSEWLRGGDDNEVLPRKRETTLEDTGGRVCYRLMALFAVKEHVLRRVVKRDEEPEHYAAIKNGKKENGLWTPVPVPAKQYHDMKVSA